MENKKVPKDWKIVKLGDVVEHIKEKIYDREEWKVDRYIGGQHFDEGEIRITKSAPIEGNELVIGSAFHMKFKPGQVLYVTRNPRLRKGGMVDFEGVCSNVTFTLEAKKDELMQELLPFVIQTENFTRHACASAHGSTNPFLNWKDIASYDLLLPPMNEQKKIAEVLWGVENTIKSCGILIRDYEKLKRKAIKDIFTSKKNGIILLGDVCDIKGRIGWRGLKAKEYTKEGPYLIAAKHIIGSKIDWDGADHLSFERYEESPEIILKEGDTILSKDGTIGRIAYIDKLPGPTTINSTMMLVRPHKEYLIPKYLYYYLGGDNFKRLVEESILGSTIPHIFQKDMKILSIPKKTLKEQEKIISILNSLEKKSNVLNNHLKSLKDLRQKLMNELLLGNLRLK